MKKVNLKDIEKSLLSIDKEDALAIGICGSLARGDYHERSDIDVFVILPDEGDSEERTLKWIYKIRNALSKFKKDVTVFVYTLNSLKKICNWYVLRLADEGKIIYDKGEIKKLFQKIIETAYRAGMKKVKRGKSCVWTIGKTPEIDKPFVIEVKDE